MWIPAQMTAPPLSRWRSAAGTSSPAGAKTMTASSFSGGPASASPAHTAPSASASSCDSSIAGASPGEDAPALPHRDLADETRRGAEPVQPDPLRVAREAERAEADQPGAEERRCRRVRIVGRDREAEALVGDRELGVAAVDVVAGEAGADAEVLALGEAEPAFAAGPAEPRDAHPGPGRVPFAVGHDLADDLMAEHERELRLSKLAVDDMQVGPTDRAGEDAHEDLAARRLRVGKLGRAESRSRGVEHQRAHAASLTLRTLRDPWQRSNTVGSSRRSSGG